MLYILKAKKSLQPAIQSPVLTTQGTKASVSFLITRNGDGQGDGTFNRFIGATTGARLLTYLGHRRMIMRQDRPHKNRIEDINAELLEALDAYLSDHDTGRYSLGLDAGILPSICDCGLCVAARKAIRKAKGADDISKLIAGLERAADLFDDIQERKAKERE